MVDKDDIIKMAREAGFMDTDKNGVWITDGYWDDELRRFAALVAAAEREKVAAWMMERGYATGHGDTIEDLLKELDWQIREQEREACAKLCLEEANEAYHQEAFYLPRGNQGLLRIAEGAKRCAEAIRARGEQ